MLIAFPLPAELSERKLCFSEKMSLQTLLAPGGPPARTLDTGEQLK